MSKPAHKNLDNPPGQLVNPDFDRYKNIMPNKSSGDVDPHYQFAKAQYENDLDLRPRRLGDIIDRVKKQEELVQKKKLTFEEWMNQRFPEGFENYDGNLGFSDLSACWRTAQENA